MAAIAIILAQYSDDGKSGNNQDVPLDVVDNLPQAMRQRAMEMNRRAFREKLVAKAAQYKDLSRVA